MISQKNRHRLRQSLASGARGIAALLPRSNAIAGIVERLSFVRSVYGPYLLNTPGDKTFELCVAGYGSFVSGAIESQDRPFVFLDIGANLGLFSLLAVRNPHCERAVAIEPLPGIFRNLEANIRRNAAGRMTPVEGAVTAAPGEFVHLSFNAGHSGMSRIVAEPTAPVRASIVSTTMLDRLIPDPVVAIVAKIDVEGSEPDVLSTLRRTRFYGAIREIIIEISETNLGAAKRNDLIAMLAQDGFEEMSRAGSPVHYDARYRRADLS